MFFKLFLNFKDNGNVPNTTYMWDTYKTQPNWVACRLVRGEVCAKFSYKFNGACELHVKFFIKFSFKQNYL